MSEAEKTAQASAPFKLWPLIVGVLVMLLMLTLANQWYAQNVAMPRYCEDPVQTLERVRRLLTEKTPAEDDFSSRRPYIVAAKLLFLIPSNSEEDEAAYLLRIRQYLEEQCR